MQSLPGKAIFFLLLLPFTLTAASQGDTLWNRTDEKGWKQGYWKKYYPGGQLMYRGYFIDNVPAGKMERYYDDGHLKAELDYAGSTTYATMYFRNGQKGASGKYVDQQRDSVWNYYSYYTGDLSCRETYRMGLLEGPVIKYYPGGARAEVLNWENNVKHGRWEQFWEDSTLRLTASYELDRLNGPYRVFNRNKILILEGNYENGMMEGDWKFYNNEGVLERTLRYSSGEILNGEELMKWAREFMDNVEKDLGKFPEPDFDNFFDKMPRKP
jgi:antitoxin component YwqK of YwqJK toxin-antitoxin module